MVGILQVEDPAWQSPLANSLWVRMEVSFPFSLGKHEIHGTHLSRVLTFHKSFLHIPVNIGIVQTLRMSAQKEIFHVDRRTEGQIQKCPQIQDTVQ